MKQHPNSSPTAARAKHLCVAAAASLLAACASVPLAPPDADAAAKKFETTPDKSNLYIYRNESFGGAVRMSVLVDNQLAGDTAAHTYILKSVAPGQHTVISKSENDSSCVVNAEPGHNYFLWQEVKTGIWSARSFLQAVDQETGKAGVSDSKLVLSP